MIFAAVLSHWQATSQGPARKGTGCTARPALFRLRCQNGGMGTFQSKAAEEGLVHLHKLQLIICLVQS